VGQTSVVGSSGKQPDLSGYVVSPCVSASSSHQSTFCHRSCSAASSSDGPALCGPAAPETQEFQVSPGNTTATLKMYPIHLMQRNLEIKYLDPKKYGIKKGIYQLTAKQRANVLY